MHALKDIYLIRHGETTWNVERRLQGHTDIPLNTKGILQARQMAQALKNTKLLFDVLYTSDLKRAADTANAIVELFGVEAWVDSALRERHFGALQGLLIQEAPLLQPAIWQAHLARCDLQQDKRRVDDRRDPLDTHAIPLAGAATRGGRSSQAAIRLQPERPLDHAPGLH